ncbi:MAG: orotidine-5'-phosphate decarboxylase [Armatimonadota bacterium]|nr:orotidine-5'-phosphate decarboxylase [Armatimonadota bacterium]
MEARQRIIVALDVDAPEKAVELVRTLKDDVGAFKVGLELVNAAGTGIFEAIRSAGVEHIFYDAKFHDIPNTVAGAVRAATRLGVWMINVHCSGGREMMRAAAQAAHEEATSLGLQPPKVIGVTVLTSIDETILRQELRVPGSLLDHVVHLAQLAQDAGLEGVVASPQEVEHIRAACGPDFLIVTPGIRPLSADSHDQKRVATPSEAIRRGADYIVVGRPITQSPDPKRAARSVVAELREL